MNLDDSDRHKAYCFPESKGTNNKVVLQTNHSVEAGTFQLAHEAEELGYSLELVTHCAKFKQKAHKKHADSK